MLTDAWSSRVAIVDYGMGNLFSIKHACEHVGLQPLVTSSPAAVLAAEAVILPGVGAFGDAMATLKRLDLVTTLQEIAASGKPLLGVCLGMQLLMTESYEFGRHQGLGIIEGDVVRLWDTTDATPGVKVPQVGWNHLRSAGRPWERTLLESVPDGAFMYFVHSFYVRPVDASQILSTTRYGSVEFCSTLQRRNIMACQFHPERSGLMGLQIYRNLTTLLKDQRAMPEAQHA